MRSDELTLVLNPEDSRLTGNRQEVNLALGLGSRQFGEGRVLIEAEDDRTVLGREHQQMDFGALGLPQRLGYLFAVPEDLMKFSPVVFLELTGLPGSPYAYLTLTDTQ